MSAHGDRVGRGCERLAWLALVALAPSACSEAPSMMRPASRPAHTLSVLGWWLLAIAILVVVIIGVLELIPIIRHRGSTLADTALVNTAPSTRWIVIGVVLTGLTLLGTFAYSMVVMGETVSPDERPALTIEITGHRWWWEARYPRTKSSMSFTTANELHIPVGVPVRLEVASADVIHSFWVPRLHGKIDLIPGVRNQFWIRADSAGRYRGQCAEYCGLQHSNMALYVTAESAEQFRNWLALQSRPAAAPQGSEAARGLQRFMQTCALCHTVRGTEAKGVMGPDLTHVASRETIAGAALTNNRGNLSGWVVNAPSLKPGTLMPRIDLEPDELHAVVSYLETLR
ncbi:MAG TPA: cytochrome c oxidase subunit II [Gemmatimonadaceae bacterium]|nr:cytochrome c oxidase subunit II [Gemmatimonadaceae bacterium]